MAERISVEIPTTRPELKAKFKADMERLKKALAGQPDYENKMNQAVKLWAGEMGVKAVKKKGPGLLEQTRDLTKATLYKALPEGIAQAQAAVYGTGRVLAQAGVIPNIEQTGIGPVFVPESKELKAARLKGIASEMERKRLAAKGVAQTYEDEPKTRTETDTWLGQNLPEAVKMLGPSTVIGGPITLGQVFGKAPYVGPALQLAGAAGTALMAGTAQYDETADNLKRQLTIPMIMMRKYRITHQEAQEIIMGIAHNELMKQAWIEGLGETAADYAFAKIFGFGKGNWKRLIPGKFMAKLGVKGSQEVVEDVTKRLGMGLFKRTARATGNMAENILTQTGTEMGQAYFQGQSDERIAKRIKGLGFDYQTGGTPEEKARKVVAPTVLMALITGTGTGTLNWLSDRMGRKAAAAAKESQGGPTGATAAGPAMTELQNELILELGKFNNTKELEKKLKDKKVPPEQWAGYKAMYSQLKEAQGKTTAAEQKAAQAAQEAQGYKEMALTDQLTGLPNLRATSAEVGLLGEGSVLGMSDIDLFKKINDTYGHPSGDLVLKELAYRIRSVSKKYGISVSRIGGEEFAYWNIPEDPAIQQQWADDLLTKISSKPFTIEGGKKINVTSSLGIGGIDLGEGNRFNNADRALYLAKESGRNQVQFDGPAAMDAAQRRAAQTAQNNDATKNIPPQVLDSIKQSAIYAAGIEDPDMIAQLMEQQMPGNQTVGEWLDGRSRSLVMESDSRGYGESLAEISRELRDRMQEIAAKDDIVEGGIPDVAESQGEESVLAAERAPAESGEPAQALQPEAAAPEGGEGQAVAGGILQEQVVNAVEELEHDIIQGAADPDIMSYITGEANRLGLDQANYMAALAEINEIANLSNKDRDNIDSILDKYYDQAEIEDRIIDVPEDKVITEDTRTGEEPTEPGDILPAVAPAVELAPANEVMEEGQPLTEKDIPKLCKQLMNPRQMQAILGSREHADILARMESDFKNLKKSQRQAEDPIAYAHFFLGGCDWYITNWTGGDIMDGYAILNNDYQNSEYGSVSLSELHEVTIPVRITGDVEGSFGAGVELDFFWTPKKVSHALYENNRNYFDKPLDWDATHQQRAQNEELDDQSEQELAEEEQDADTVIPVTGDYAEDRPAMSDDQILALTENDIFVMVPTLEQFDKTANFSEFAMERGAAWDMAYSKIELLEKRVKSIRADLKNTKNKAAKLEIQNDLKAAEQAAGEWTGAMESYFTNIGIQDSAYLARLAKDRGIAVPDGAETLQSMDDLDGENGAFHDVAYNENFDTSSPLVRERYWGQSLDTVIDEALAGWQDYLAQQESEDSPAPDARTTAIEEATGEIEEAHKEPEYKIGQSVLVKRGDSFYPAIIKRASVGRYTVAPNMTSGEAAKLSLGDLQDVEATDIVGAQEKGKEWTVKSALLELADEYGARAFHEGKAIGFKTGAIKAPAQDPAMMRLLEGKEAKNNTVELLKKWNDAWHRENLAEPVPGIPEKPRPVNFKLYQDKYYSYSSLDESHKEVKGTFVKNDYGLDLFAHKRLDGEGWDVSEGKTGLGVGNGINKQNAIIDAFENLDRGSIGKNKTEWDQTILNRIQKVGLSPRYRPLTTAEEAAIEEKEDADKERSADEVRSGKPESPGAAVSSGKPASPAKRAKGKRGAGEPPAAPGGEPAGGAAAGGGEAAGGGVEGAQGGAKPGISTPITGLPIPGNAEYRLSPDDIAFIEGGKSFKPKERYSANIEAIKTLKAIEEANRPATAREQAVLARYAGWGGLKNAFDDYGDGWKAEQAELKELLTEQEYSAARASVLNAHYTSPSIISAIWKAVQHLGFTSGNMIEPACGSGLFFGMMPQELIDSTSRIGVELDSLTGRIAKQLYPGANIKISGFENVNIRDNSLDLAISNVPFGAIKLFGRYDKELNKSGLSIHNYFFAKSLKKLKPGGVLAFITSHHTMDSKDSLFRQRMITQAELLGAFRLPSDAFLSNAGTSVLTDIIFLKKLAPGEESVTPWLETKQMQIKDKKYGGYENYDVNEYFIKNKDNVLGKFEIAEHGMHNGLELGVKSPAGVDVAGLLADRAMAVLPEGIIKPVEQMGGAEIMEGATAAAVPEGGYLLDDKGNIQQKVDGEMVVPKLPGDQVKRIKGMMRIKGSMLETIDGMLAGVEDKDLQKLQKDLTGKYNDFVKAYGPINSSVNAKAYSSDPSYTIIQGLEQQYNKAENKAVKADIFDSRVIQPKKEIALIQTAHDALVASLNLRGRVDVEYMAEIYGKTAEEVVAELGDRIYQDPDDGIQLAEEYLSGDVVSKLEAARMFAEENPAMKRNVVALEKVQPAPLTAAEIEMPFGATWIKPQYYADFINGLLFAGDDRITVNYSPVLGSYYVQPAYKNDTYWLKRSQANTNTYGTEYKPAHEIIGLMLNMKAPVIYEEITNPDGSKTRRKAVNETLVVQQKEELIRNAWDEWTRRPNSKEIKDIVDTYNREKNRLAMRQHDGSHLSLDGMNKTILREGDLDSHQKNAVWRIIADGRALLAHAVGAGKTYTMAAAAMELRRSGMAKKCMMMVQKNTIGQFAEQFRNLYPGARLLVADNNDFTPAGRPAFFSKIAANDWDAIIITHPQFIRIPVSRDIQMEYYTMRLEELENALQQQADREERRKSTLTKDIERAKLNYLTKLEALRDFKADEGALTFDKLGIDMLFVDEADQFKNLYHPTKLTGIAGIASTQSQRAEDLKLKSNWMLNRYGNRGLVFATGTPIANTAAEMYTMMDYLMPDVLDDMGIASFDGWAHDYAEVRSTIELKPEGGFGMRRRFAKFKNFTELLKAFRLVADVRSNSSLNLPRPALKGGENQNIASPPAPWLTDFMKALMKRAEKIRAGAVKPTEDNMLKISMDGRTAALDMRLIDSTLPDFPESKVNRCTEEVHRIWKDSTPKKGTQLIFCDLGVPGGTSGVFSEDAEMQKFDVYNDVKRKLVKMGIPEKEIALIHSYNTDTKRLQLFDKVNAGDIRIVIGSTEKMGAGTNVHQKLIAEHHLNAPWRPRDIEQREGRILRQGNTNDVVEILRYHTEDSFDAYVWQLLEKKKLSTDLELLENFSVRAFEDAEARALTYAECKALITKDPRLLEKVKVDMDVRRMEALAANWAINQQKAVADLQRLPADIQAQQNRVEKYQADSKLKRPDNENFKMVVGGKEFEERKAAGEAILAFVKQNKKGSHYDGPLGSYGDFKLSFAFDERPDRMQMAPVVKLTGNGMYFLGTEGMQSEVGVTTRIDNLIDSITKSTEKEAKELATLKEQLKGAQAAAASEFTQEKEYRIAKRKQEKLDRELGLSASVEEDDVQAAAADEDGAVAEPQEIDEEAPMAKDVSIQDVPIPAGFSKFFEKLEVNKANMDKIFEVARSSASPEEMQASLADEFDIDISIKQARQYHIMAQGGAGARQERAYLVDQALVTEAIDAIRAGNPTAAKRLDEMMAPRKNKKGEVGPSRIQREFSAGSQSMIQYGVSQVLPEYMKRRGGDKEGVLKNKVLMEMAERFGFPPEMFEMFQHLDEAIELPVKAVALGNYVDTMGVELERMAKLYLSEETTRQEKERIKSVFNAVGPNFLQSMLTYWTMGTAWGRAIQSFKLRKFTKLKTILNTIKNLTESQENLEELSEEQLEALFHQLATEGGSPASIIKMMKPTAWDMINEWQKAIKLNIVSIFKNLTSNTINAAWSGIFEKQLAVMVDVLGEKFGLERTTWGGEVDAAVKTLPIGWIQGTGQFMTYLLNDSADKSESRTQEVVRAGKVGPAIPGKFGYHVRWSFRILNAFDRFQFSLNRWAIAAQELYADGKSKGKSGKALDQHVQEGLLNWEQDKTFRKMVENEANTWLYREKLGRSNSDFAKWLNRLPVAQLVIPFFRTPVNVTKWAWRRTPGLGLMGKNFKDIKAGGRPARGAFARQISGSMITIGIASLYSLGWLTGPDPEDQAERDRFYREGKLPWAILLFGRYYSLASWEPFTSHLKIITSVMRAGQAYSKKQSKAALGKAMFLVTEALMDQTYTMGIKMLFDAATNPGRYGERFLTRFVIGMTVPTEFGHLARIADPYYRKAGGPVDVLLQTLPGLSRMLPEQLEAYGQPKERPGIAGRIMPIVLSSPKAELDQVDQELERLEFNISFPGRSYTMNGQKNLFTTEQYQARQTAGGPEIKWLIAQSMAAKGDDGKLIWPQLNDDSRRYILGNIVRSVHNMTLEKEKAKIRGGAYAQ